MRVTLKNGSRYVTNSIIVIGDNLIFTTVKGTKVSKKIRDIDSINNI